MITNYSISSILNHPAYEGNGQPGSPSSPNNYLTLSKLRKKDLEILKAGESPFRTSSRTDYGNCPFSKKAIQWKKENGVSAGRNVSIALFHSPNSKALRYTIAATDGPPGQPHAELRAYDKIPAHARKNKENIVMIYSERKPCRKGSNCHRKLKCAIDDKTQVVYSAHHTPDAKRQKTSEAEFQKIQAEHGIRIANRKIRKAAQN